MQQVVVNLMEKQLILIIKEKNARAIILEWEWEFDGDDEKDTIIGVLGEKYYINIEIIAEEA